MTGVEADIEGDGVEYTTEDIEGSEVVAADIVVGWCFAFLGWLLVTVTDGTGTEGWEMLKLDCEKGEAIEGITGEGVTVTAGEVDPLVEGGRIWMSGIWGSGNVIVSL